MNLTQFRQAEHQTIARQYGGSDGYAEVLTFWIFAEHREILPEPVNAAPVIAQPVVAIAKIESGWHRKDGLGESASHFESMACGFNGTSRVAIHEECVSHARGDLADAPLIAHSLRQVVSLL